MLEKCKEHPKLSCSNLGYNPSITEIEHALTATYPNGKGMNESMNVYINHYFPLLAKITNIREMAMFYAQVFYESGGLKYKEELACMHNPAKCTYVNNTGGQPGKYYYGRGYIQLTHAYNYHAASMAIFGDDRLVKTPELVATDDYIAWKTALWFWGENVHAKPGVKEGHFDVTTTWVNGPKSKSRDKRFIIYSKVYKAFLIDGLPMM